MRFLMGKRIHSFGRSSFQFENPHLSFLKRIISFRHKLAILSNIQLSLWIVRYEYRYLFSHKENKVWLHSWKFSPQQVCLVNLGFFFFFILLGTCWSTDTLAAIYGPLCPMISYLSSQNFLQECASFPSPPNAQPSIAWLAYSHHMTSQFLHICLFEWLQHKFLSSFFQAPKLNN